MALLVQQQTYKCGTFLEGYTVDAISLKPIQDHAVNKVKYGQKPLQD